MDERQIHELTEEASLALQSGNYVRAVAITEQLTTLLPDDPTVCAIRAEALLKTDATDDEAVAVARHAVDLDPQNQHLRTVLGLAAWRAEKLTLAQQALERAVELSGEEPNVVADFAFFLAAARGPRLAEEAANEAVCANHKCAAAWAALGLAQFRRRRRRAAEASVRRALELDPNDPYALAVMLALLHERRDNARAVALAELLKDSRGTEEFVAVRLFLRNYGLPDLSGTEEFVETIQEQAKKREVAKELIERRALREPTYYDESPRLLGFALILTVLIIAALVALIVLQPSLAPVIILFGLIPLVLLWFFRRFVD